MVSLGIQAARMHRHRGNEGLTTYQLIVAIVAFVISGALWGAYNKQQQIKQLQQSCLTEVRNG